MAAPRKIPFPFILDHLHAVKPVIKLMFGCHAVYVRDKIVCILRDSADHTDANGMWIATKKEHHESLRNDFPSMTSVFILSNGKGETGWQMIHVDDDQFEHFALHACDLIMKGDIRIGNIPKKKKAKK